MIHRTGIVVLAMGLAAAASAPAQDVIISKQGGEQMTLDDSGFAAPADGPAAVFGRTLRSDLRRTGWFTVVAPGRGEIRLTGSAASRGQEVEAKVQAVSTATGRAALSKGYRGAAGEARRLAHAVADDIVEAVTGQPGFASSRLAVIGRRGTAKELFLCDSDGENLQQITRDGTISLYPRWSPDRTRIVYTSYLKRFPDVLMIDLAQGRRTRLAAFPGLNAGGAMSPDGRSVALILSRDGNPELYVMRLADGTLTRLTNTPRAAESSPSWSPKGDRIVYVSDVSGRPQLYLIGRDGSAPRRLTARGFENVAPDWGRHGLIAHAQSVGGRYQLAITDPATGETRTLGQDAAEWEDPTWARDGRHLAAVRKDGRGSAIYLVDTRGGDPIPLLTVGDWFSPAWSP